MGKNPVVSPPARLYYNVVHTPFGEAVVVGRQEGDRFLAVRIMLPQKERPVAERVEKEFPGAVYAHTAGAGICSHIAEFFEGSEAGFDTADVDTGIVQGFARRVLAKAAEIPRGFVMTYSGLAASIGVPGGARAVGNALAWNPFPLVYPCHRVIRKDGTLGGFGGGLTLKRSLLEMEGVSFDRWGRVMQQNIREGGMM